MRRFFFILAPVLGVLSAWSHGGMLSVSNSKGFDSNPVVDPGGVLLTGADPILVTMGTFANEPAVALPSSEERVDGSAYDNLLSGFTRFGSSVALIRPVEPLNLRGVFHFQARVPVAGTPLEGKPVYAVVTRGADLESATQVLILRLNGTFESADDEMAFPRMISVGIDAGTILIVGSQTRFSGVATNLDPVPNPAYSLAAVTRSGSAVVPPFAATGEVSEIDGVSARLAGTVNPRGALSDAWFEYGLTMSYGSQVAVTLVPGDGTEEQTVTAVVPGLQAGQVYHYRMVASNGGGVTFGQDRSFLVHPLEPSIAVKGEDGISVPDGSAQSYGATLNGTRRVKTFTIQNPGTGVLSGVSLQITGVSAASFVVTRAPTASVPAGGSTSFDLAFVPASSGPKAAALRILSTAGGDLNPYDISLAGVGGTTLAAHFSPGGGTPLIVDGFEAAGKSVDLSLGQALAVGKSLMVVENTGSGFIQGSFSNLEHGRIVELSHEGITYRMVADYFGGSGNDLVLQWADTRLLAWGENSNGALGDSTTLHRVEPVEVISSGVLSEKTVTRIAAGRAHSLALCSDGVIAAWGWNIAGQLGDDTTSRRTEPVEVKRTGVLNGKTVVAVAAGGDFSLALCSDGMVAAWGLNNRGQLGDGSRINRKVPVWVDSTGVLAGKMVVAIAAGNDHCLALCADGSVAAWGGNGSGQLGNGDDVDQVFPVLVAQPGFLAGKRPSQIAAGHYHSMLLCMDGTLAVWGDNTFGELGTGGESSMTPVQVPWSAAQNGVWPVSIAAGRAFSVAMATDGTLTFWGDNSSGVMGETSLSQSLLPREFVFHGALSGKRAVDFTCGADHMVAMLGDGSLAAWGDNDSGQAGQGSLGGIATPGVVRVGALRAGERVLRIASGPSASHSVALAAMPPASLAGPLVTDRAVTDLTADSARLHALVNPNGFETAVTFEYGRDITYGSETPVQNLAAGNVSVEVESGLSGLHFNTGYHYRVKAVNSHGTTFGQDMLFVTEPVPPVATTLAAEGVTSTTASLVGSVLTNFLETDAYFEIGLNELYGTTLPVTRFVREDQEPTQTEKRVEFPLAALLPDTTYHYRLVARNAGGRAFGEDLTFRTGATGMPATLPVVATGEATAVNTVGAILHGQVNPNGSIGNVFFEYRTETGPVVTTVLYGAGDGNLPVSISAPVTGLAPGTLYWFRVVARNGAGLSRGAELPFTTAFLPPVVRTEQQALPVSSGTVSVYGVARANRAASTVYFDYGPSPGSLTSSVAAEPGAIGGDDEIRVSGKLPNLVQGETYYYRVRAVSTGGESRGEVHSFRMGLLSGLLWRFPGEPPEASGNVVVHLEPPGIEGGWRFAGEPKWRASGETATVLASGNREIEFRGVAGYLHPPSRIVSVINRSTVVVEEVYYETEMPATGGVMVDLQPSEIAVPSLPASQRVQWRFIDEGDSAWRNSGVLVERLLPGIHVVECKWIGGWTTPSRVAVTVVAGSNAVETLSYEPALVPTAVVPSMVEFPQSSGDQSKPYAFVGQVRSGAGGSSGFLVRPGVVATAGHVVFDDVTLAAATGLQWLFQRDMSEHETCPLVPRGFYLLDGYAALRIAEQTPGVSSLASKERDAAALYFPDGADPGRGGFSGFLASDANNEYLLSSSREKILVGYPVEETAASNVGRMHATAVVTSAFFPASTTHPEWQVYATNAMLGRGGMSGGPVCVRHDNGHYYPAAIYLGGSDVTMVRAIDSLLVQMFARAEDSGRTGRSNTGGGITHTSVSGTFSAAKAAALKVLIEPEAARVAGARWRLKPDTVWRTSGSQKGRLRQGSYTLEFTTVAGYQIPAPQTLWIPGGQLTTVVFSYAGNLTPLETWRAVAFDTVVDAGAAADDEDPDQDGRTNLEEYAAGTDPNDATDALRVLGGVRTAGGYTVTTAGKAGRVYVLQRSLGLGGGLWSDVATAGPLAVDGPVALTDGASPAGQAFYRIRVSVP